MRLVTERSFKVGDKLKLMSTFDGKLKKGYATIIGKDGNGNWLYHWYGWDKRSFEIVGWRMNFKTFRLNKAEIKIEELKK